MSSLKAKKAKTLATRKRTWKRHAHDAGWNVSNKKTEHREHGAAKGYPARTWKRKTGGDMFDDAPAPSSDSSAAAAAALGPQPVRHQVRARGGVSWRRACRMHLTGLARA